MLFGFVPFFLNFTTIHFLLLFLSDSLLWNYHEFDRFWYILCPLNFVKGNIRNFALTFLCSNNTGTSQTLSFLSHHLGCPIELYLHLRQSLEPARSEITAVAILAAPRRLNLSLNWQLQSCTWSSRISSVLISPSAEKCAAVLLLCFFLELHSSVNPHLKPKYSTDTTNYKRISVNRKIKIPFGILIKPKAYLNWV